jgi:hypothetical protein
MWYGIYNVAPSLFTFFSSVFLGAWALFAAPRSVQHRVFALGAAAVAVWAISNFGLNLSETPATAMFWSRMIGSGWVFIGAIFLHFVLLLTKREGVFTNRWSYLALYGPGLLFLGMFWLTDLFYSGVKQTPFGFTMVIEWGTLLPGAYAGVSIMLSLYYSLKAYWEFSMPEKAQVGMVAIAIGGVGIGCFILYGVLPLIGIETFGLEAAILFPYAIIVMAIATVKYKLFSPPPISRFLVPLPEMELCTKPKFKLEKGRGYLITKEKPLLHKQNTTLLKHCLKMERKQWCGLTIFMDQINHGVPGLWITSLRPKQVTKYSLRRTPVVYLTNEQIKGEVTLPLRRLDKVRDLVSSYLLRVRGKSVVLIDSFEELIAGDEFERKIEFLKEMVELCSKNNSNLIVQVDSNKLKNEQLAAIEKVIPPL